jgi:CRISPR-associated Cas5-like protein
MSDRALRATLDVPVECAFTKAGAMNGLPTYEVPPVPTLQGLLYAALGRPSLLQVRGGGPDNDVRDREERFRDRVADECSFGIRVLESGTDHTSLRKRHKASRSGADTAFITYVARMETLISPTYRMYVGGPDDLLESFQEALQDPERLLYLGRSDDLVDVRDVDLISVQRMADETTLDCVTPGPGADVTLLPVEPDYRSGLTTQPARVETVSATGGQVDGYYETSDGERFVYLT